MPHAERDMLNAEMLTDEPQINEGGKEKVSGEAAAHAHER